MLKSGRALSVISLGSSRRSSKDAGETEKAAKRQKTGGRLPSTSCSDCRREWTSPNPVNASLSKYPTLPRSKGYGPRCDVCRGCFNTTRKGKSIAEHDEELKVEANYAAWMITLENYEDQRNGVALRHQDAAPESRDGPLTVVTQNEDSTILRSATVGHFWALPLLDANNIARPHEKAFIKDFDVNGDLVLGVMRTVAEDAKLFHHLPEDVVVLKKQLKKGVQRVKELDRSDQHLVVGQGNQAWSSAMASTACSRERTTIGEGDNAVTKIQLIGVKATQCDAESEDDDFGCFASNATPKNKKQQHAMSPTLNPPTSTLPAPSPSSSSRSLPSNTATGAAGAAGSDKTDPSEPGAPKKKKKHNKNPAPAVLPGQSHRAKQLAAREVSTCEKTLATTELSMKDLLDEQATTSVTYQNLQSLYEKLEKHLASTVRWVYLAEEVTEDDDKNNAIADKRSAMLISLQAARRMLGYFRPVVHAFHATQDKDPLAYDARSFADAIRDAFDADVKLPLVYPTKAVDRWARSEMQHALDQHECLWKTSLESKFENVTFTEGLFTSWSKIVDMNAVDEPVGMAYLQAIAEKQKPGSSDLADLVQDAQTTFLIDGVKSAFMFTFEMPESSDEEEDTDNDDDIAEKKRLAENIVAYKLSFIASVLTATVKVHVANVEMRAGFEDLERMTRADKFETPEINAMLERNANPKHAMFKLVQSSAGTILTEHARSTIRYRVVETRCLKQLKGIRSNMEADGVQLRDAKVKLAEGTMSANRWREALRPLRDYVLQYRQAMVSCNSERISSSKDFVYVEKELTAFCADLDARFLTRFRRTFATAVSLYKSDWNTAAVDMKKLHDELLVMNMQGLAPNEIDEQQMIDRINTRASLVSTMHEGFAAPPEESKQVWTVRCANLKKLTRLLLDFELDSTAFVHPDDVAPWQADSLRQEIDQSRNGVLDDLQGKYSREMISRNHHASARVGLSNLDAVWQQIKASEDEVHSDVEKSELYDTDGLFATATPDVLKGEYVVMSPKDIDEWRAAAVPLFLQRNPDAKIALRPADAESGDAIEVGVQAALIANEFVPIYQRCVIVRKKVCSESSDRMMQIYSEMASSLVTMPAQVQRFSQVCVAVFASGHAAALRVHVQHGVKKTVIHIMDSVATLMETVVQDVSRQSQKVAEQNIDKIVAEAGDDFMSQKTKTACMKVVNGAAAKQLKKQFKVFRAIEGFPERIAKTLKEAFTAQESEIESRLDSIVTCCRNEEVSKAKTQIANLAIVQSTFRPLLQGESRDELQGQAAGCAVTLDTIPLSPIFSKFLQSSEAATSVFKDAAEKAAEAAEKAAETA